MTQNTAIEIVSQQAATRTNRMSLFYIYFAGIMAALGFAPFHLPGFAILSLALLFAQLSHKTSSRHSFLIGFIYGMGFFSLGVTWIYVSIYEYGHLNPIVSAAITALFVAYLSCFPAFMTFVYIKLKKNRSPLFCCFLFAALWCLNETLRATCLGGFPWLLIGFGQIDAPLQYLLPIVGLYGVGFLTCFAAACLTLSVQQKHKVRYIWLFLFVSILVAPSFLKNIQWTNVNETPISIGVIQENISMRDKWDETLFWKLLSTYKKRMNQFIGKVDVIVLPESAIPLPAHYVSDVMNTLDTRAKKQNSAILFGIPQPTSDEETEYYNTISSMGTAQGSYIKQQLVPFGEYIPDVFVRLMNWLSVPISNLKAHTDSQELILVNNHPIATLICYELAYPGLLKHQLPAAEWIVSISDDGWFGHSLAMYQHLQMAQVLSILTGRYQVVANNDGLSSLIDQHGNIIGSLPPFTASTLTGKIYSASGSTPWVYFGETPAIVLCLSILLFATIIRYTRSRHKRAN